MSVIVKGLDLPAYKEGYKNRYVCLLVLNPDGTTDLYVADKKYPVSTVPTPHGRLIDVEGIWILPESFRVDCLLGTAVFLTREEAEQALKESKENPGG